MGTGRNEGFLERCGTSMGNSRFYFEGPAVLGTELTKLTGAIPLLCKVTIRLLTLL